MYFKHHRVKAHVHAGAVLEAYTLQLDYYLSQLSDLSADIEEFWMTTQQDLGKKRNSLFAFQILVNTVTMGFSFVAMVAGIFGVTYLLHCATVYAYRCSRY